jgi:hypothetical protein
MNQDIWADVLHVLMLRVCEAVICNYRESGR